MNRVLLLRAGLACVAGAVGGFLLFQWLSSSPPAIAPVRRVPSASQYEHSHPPVSPFLNTKPDAVYVGSQACLACHPDEHGTYQQTGMGNSLAELDIGQEPASSTFTHELSGRKYTVYRKDKQMHHREVLLVDEDEYLLADHPVQYVIGSGNHSRSYLVEVDGFLCESPITWYPSKQDWSVSPGYDTPMTFGFTREVPQKCLFCHAGRTHSVGNSLHRIKFDEHAIGCERCHGPGSLHVERWESSDAGGDEAIDRTIVNPAHLSRELADAICHQCHLTTEAYITARGRKTTDFRPGLPLQRFRHYYRARAPESSMRVVGHVDQLMLSRCYLESDSLTCMTCHNPHAFPAPEQQMKYYRDVCASCHAIDACQVSSETLARKSPANDCVACHMPSSPTDIPHMAFTHHRIGIHNASLSGDVVREDESTVELEPLYDLSFLSRLDRERSRGLAYFDLSRRAKSRRQADAQMRRVYDRLLQVRREGVHDGQVDTALAQIIWRQDPQAAASFADSALKDESLPSIARVNALYALATSYLAQRRVEEALEVLQELTQLRRHAADWSLMGECYFALKDISEGVRALEEAVQIDSNLLEVHTLLAQHYERTGDTNRAERCRALAKGITAAISRSQGDEVK